MTISSSLLDKIAAQLTPQQAVIRFTDDAHRVPSFDEWLCERLQEGGHTLRRLADRVVETVRSNMRAEGRGRDGQQLIDRAVRRTKQDVAFLHHLHWNVNRLAAAQSQTHALQRVCLSERLRGILVLEFVRFDLAWVRHFLADEVPYPLDPETAAAVLARIQYDIAPWVYLQDCIEEWVYAWYVDQGKTTLPSGVYSCRQLDANDDRPDEVEIRSAFAEAEAYTEWKEGRDYQYGLTDVRDADYQRVCDQVEQAIRDLIGDGTVKRGTAVRLETVPQDFLQIAPLIDNEWIDRYVVELAEWGSPRQSWGYV